jgi:hypothetical protein
LATVNHPIRDTLIVSQESNGKFLSVKGYRILPIATLLILPLQSLLGVADEDSIRAGLRHARPHVQGIAMQCASLDFVVCPRPIRYSYRLGPCAARDEAKY